MSQGYVSTALVNTFLSVFLLLVLCFPTSVYATLGVGVGTPKIQVEEPLKPGGTYTLPNFIVMNTGDEATHYTVGVMYHEDQTELRPHKEWFTFSPQSFDIDPGKAKIVEVKIQIPRQAQEGEYFAFLEATPKIETESGATKIAIAAAGKLTFRVKKAKNTFPLQGITVALGVLTILLGIKLIKNAPPKNRVKRKAPHFR